MEAPIHIVHVEDDRPLSRILDSTLHAAAPNVNLLQFSSAEEALTYITSQNDSVDLYVLDVRLTGRMDGLQLAEKIREMGFTGHIIVTSAFNSPAQHWLDGLHAEFLPKPWHVLDLTDKLTECRSKRLPKSRSAAE